MTNTQSKSRKKFIRYYQALICVDGLQLFVGIGAKNRYYICLAVPSEVSDELFLCSPVTNENLDDYLYERIDLYALIKASTNNKFYTIDFSQETNRGYLLKEIETLPMDWLPERHIFSRCHTEEFNPESRVRMLDLETEDQTINIDGRWDTKDLSIISDLFIDGYSFLYALKRNELIRSSSANEVFNRYPWRGGFSTVGFYNGLYSQIPRKHRLSVQGIEYHSPGKIVISAVSVLADEVKSLVAVYINDRKDIMQAYRELYDGMSLRELLGRSTEEVEAEPLDFTFVETATKHLAEKMHFTMLDQLVQMTGNNWLVSAKILMSYFRRLKALSDFFDSGKAAFAD